MSLSYKTIIDNLKGDKRLSLRCGNVQEDDVKSLVQALKCAQITSLDLGNNRIGCNGLKYLAQALKDTQITELDLTNNNIMCEGVKVLSESLKNTRITVLNLTDNDIKDEGVKVLSESLKGTQITSLDLGNNSIGCNGLKYLAQALRDTQTESLNDTLELDLSGNKIGPDAAQYIYEMVNNKKISVGIDVYFTKYRPNITHYNKDITIIDNEIGINGAQYLNKTFQNIPIGKLQFNGELKADEVQHLAQAFKGAKIYKLEINTRHIYQDNGIQYLVQILENSQIFNLELEVINGNIQVKCLSEFLKKVKVYKLDLAGKAINDEDMKILVAALKNSDIMYIDLRDNGLEAQGARYLSEILQNCKIMDINLSGNSIGTDGVRYLADGLPYSQVTDIHLHENPIEYYAGYQYLIDVVDKTNISRVNLHHNNMEEAGLEEGTELLPFSIPRNSITVAYTICHAFKELVSLNSVNNEFEFIVSSKNIDIDRYAFLIRTLNDNPNSKVHIFHMMCHNDLYYDLNIMNKINDFITIIPNKFNTFFNSILLDLVESLCNYNFVNLLKQFETMNMYDIVQNLLLHRVLYYVDENQEILHPYIYKMLNKYSMPLYNEQLEPNKKQDIISYYQSHQELDGTQEIIDLLQKF